MKNIFLCFISLTSLLIFFDSSACNEDNEYYEELDSRDITEFDTKDYKYIADILYYKGDHEDAIHYYKMQINDTKKILNGLDRCQKTKPCNVSQFSNLYTKYIYSLCELGDHESAKQVFEEALRFKPQPKRPICEVSRCSLEYEILEIDESDENFINSLKNKEYSTCVDQWGRLTVSREDFTSVINEYIEYKKANEE